MTAPDPGPREVTVTRYICPHCSRGHSKKPAAIAHIARCWKNPRTRSCKTCAHHVPAAGELGGCFPGVQCTCDIQEEGCEAGQDMPDDRLASNCPGWEARPRTGFLPLI